MADRPLRVAFMGSPEFAVPCLAALVETPGVTVPLVVTQPDQPAGRGRKLSPTAVRAWAEARGLPVETPPSVRKPPYAPRLAELDLDLAVVVAYGKILPPDLLAAPRHGCWNVHASLLPKFRGASPAQWAILEGEAETGVTLMQLDAGMDTGPTLLRRSIPIAEEDTAGSLLEKLSPLGASVLAEGLRVLQSSGTVAATPQDDARATMAPLLDKEHGRVIWAEAARRVHGRVRAMDPWPGAFTTLGDEVLKLWRPRLVSGRGAPGTVLGADRDGLIVACGDGAVALGELQLPGKKRMPAQALLAGRPIPVGTVLGANPPASPAGA